MGRLPGLILILSLCTASQATVTLKINGEEPPQCGDKPLHVELLDLITVEIHSDAYNKSYGVYLGFADVGSAEWVGTPIALPEAGATPRIRYYEGGSEEPGYWLLEAISFTPVVPIEPGLHFEAQFRLTEYEPGDPPVCVMLWQYSAPHPVLDSASFIPEPATVSLMALGTAALIRRRRSPGLRTAA